MARRRKFDDDKQGGLDNNDEFEYKNADHSQLISDVIAYDKVDRIQDLYDMVDSFTNLTPDNINEVREEMVKQGDPNIPFANMTDSELTDYMHKQAIKTKESIDKYR